MPFQMSECKRSFLLTLRIITYNSSTCVTLLYFPRAVCQSVGFGVLYVVFITTNTNRDKLVLFLLFKKLPMHVSKTVANVITHFMEVYLLFCWYNYKNIMSSLTMYGCYSFILGRSKTFSMANSEVIFNSS